MGPPTAAGPRPDDIRFVCRRPCLPAEREPDVAEAVGDAPVWAPRRVVTTWWDGGVSPP